MQVPANGQGITIIINQRQAETLHIGWPKIGIPYLVTVIRALPAVRVQGIEWRTLDISGILSRQEPAFERVKSVSHAYIRKKIQIIPFKRIVPVNGGRIFSPYARRQVPTPQFSRERGISARDVLMISQQTAIIIVRQPKALFRQALINRIIIHRGIGIFCPELVAPSFPDVFVKREIRHRQIIIRRRMTPVKRVPTPILLFLTDLVIVIPVRSFADIIHNGFQGSRSPYQITRIIDCRRIGLIILHLTIVSKTFHRHRPGSQRRTAPRVSIGSLGTITHLRTETTQRIRLEDRPKTACSIIGFRITVGAGLKILSHFTIFPPTGHLAPVHRCQYSGKRTTQTPTPDTGINRSLWRITAQGRRERTTQREISSHTIVRLPTCLDPDHTTTSRGIIRSSSERNNFNPLDIL